MNHADKDSSDRPEPESTDSGPGMSDAEAINAVLAGYTDAFEAIVSRYEGLLFATLFCMLGNADDAADATQEAFVKAYTNLGRYNPSRPFKPWLFRIATNTAISRQRQMKHRQSALLSDSIADGSPTPRQRAEANELGERLESAINRLPGEARELFELRYRRDLSAKEIAHITGRKPNAVIVALHRLRTCLRTMVFGSESKPPPKETRT